MSSGAKYHLPAAVITRELTLPWAHLSFPVRWRPGQSDSCSACWYLLLSRMPASATANAGSCPLGPKLVIIAALLVEKPPSTGGPGMLVKLIEPLFKARNAAENRPDAVARVNGSNQLLPSQRRQHVSSSRLCRRSKTRPPLIRYRNFPVGTQSVGQHQPAPQNLVACRVVGPQASSCPRPVPPTSISVPAHVARHYGVFASGKPGTRPPGAAVSRPVTSVIVDCPQATKVMSSCIEHERPPGISCSCPPKIEEEAGGRIFRSPASLGIGGEVARPCC